MLRAAAQMCEHGVHLGLFVHPSQLVFSLVFYRPLPKQFICQNEMHTPGLTAFAMRMQLFPFCVIFWLKIEQKYKNDDGMTSFGQCPNFKCWMQKKCWCSNPLTQAMWLFLPGRNYGRVAFHGLNMNEHRLIILISFDTHLFFFFFFL